VYHNLAEADNEIELGGQLVTDSQGKAVAGIFGLLGLGAGDYQHVVQPFQADVVLTFFDGGEPEGIPKTYRQAILEEARLTWGRKENRRPGSGIIPSVRNGWRHSPKPLAPFSRASN
jgi:hypothetical protein